MLDFSRYEMGVAGLPCCPQSTILWLMLRLIGLVLLLSLLPVSATVQFVSLDTTPTWDGTGVATFAGDGAAAWGQVITAPEEATSLDSFSFFVDEFSYFVPVDVQAIVTPWVNQNVTELDLTLSRAQAPVLYKSEIFTTDGTRGAWQEVAFDTGGINLIGGEQYILFLSVYDIYVGRRADLKIGYSDDDTYSGGENWFTGTASTEMPLHSAFDSNWAQLPGSNGGPTDMAFKATFSSIPEPAAGTMLGLGLVFLCRRSRAVRE